MGYSFTVKKGKLPDLVRIFGMHVTDLSEDWSLLRDLTLDDFRTWPDTVMTIAEVPNSKTGSAYQFRLHQIGVGFMSDVEFVGFFDNQILVDKFLQSLTVDFKKMNIDIPSSTVWLTYPIKA